MIRKPQLNPGGQHHEHHCT